MMEHYEVQTHTLCNGWVNCWSIHTAEGSFPATFLTYDEAAEELQDLLEAWGDDYSLDDYRIVKVPSIDAAREAAEDRYKYHEEEDTLDLY